MSREIGKKLYREGRIKDALDQFLGEGLDPSQDGELAYHVGLCYTKMGDDDLALTYLLRVLEIDFHILRAFQSRMVIAFIYNRQREGQQAVLHLETLLKDGFESPQIFSSLAFAYWIQGDTQRAVELYQRALDLDPKHVTSLNSLGYIWAEEGENLKEAMEYCQQAVAMDPLNPNYLDSLGWACYKGGRMAEAVDYLGRACQNKGVHETVKKHYEEVLQAR